MLGVVGRRAGGAFDGGSAGDVVPLHSIQAAFHFPDRFQVFLHPAAIGGADARMEAARLFNGAVQNAAAVTGAAGSSGAIPVR